MLIRGLQTGFRDSIAGVLPDLVRLRVQAVRIDCQKLGAERTRALTAEVTDAGLLCLTTVYDAADAALLPPGSHVEFRGEPDIGHPSHYADTQPIAPAVYRQLLTDFYAAADARGLVVWGGVISNLNERGIDWLSAARVDAWPAAINVAIHWYPHGDAPQTPHPGFVSRDREVEAFTAVIGRRPWIVSEFGYHTAPRPRYVSIFGLRVRVGTTRWTDAQVADFACFEWAFWERHGAIGAVWYQVNDGPNDGDPNERYGIRRIDGTFKPVADTFAEGR